MPYRDGTCDVPPRATKVPPMRLPVAAIGVVLALGLAACGSSQPTIGKQSLSKLVLREQDLGAPFSEFYSGRQASLDNQGTNRSDPERYGREGGWIARFRRSGTAATKGPLLVESRADLFRNAGGAKKDLLAYRALFASAAGAQRRVIKLPKLGDDALGQTFVQPATKPLRFFQIAWRFENATAAVTVEGFDGKIQASAAIALARKQQHRLERG
jgi:hypothetical protein